MHTNIVILYYIKLRVIVKNINMLNGTLKLHAFKMQVGLMIMKK